MSNFQRLLRQRRSQAFSLWLLRVGGEAFTPGLSVLRRAQTDVFKIYYALTCFAGCPSPRISHRRTRSRQAFTSLRDVQPLTSHREATQAPLWGSSGKAALLRPSGEGPKPKAEGKEGQRLKASDPFRGCRSPDLRLTTGATRRPLDWVWRESNPRPYGS